MVSKKKIIIIGGGFAGLHLARKLNRSDFDVILIDRQNHHQFQPLFYQVASARLEPSTISFPFRKIFQRSGSITFHLAEVMHVDTAINKVFTSVGSFTYDYLVIASGCQTNYFGNAEVMVHALPMKTTADAINIRNRILLGFEKLFSLKNEDISAFLNIVIVGGGPTGVELAGAFAEMKKVILPRDYPGYDFSKLEIILIEKNDETLHNMSELARKTSVKYLNELGVKIITNTIVSNYDGTTLMLANGKKIDCKNLIWAAGITGNLIDGIDPGIITSSGRYVVDRQNRIKGYDNVFAIGDISFMETPRYPNGHPQVANVAIGQGKVLAANLRVFESGGKAKDYEYTDLGSMATIGKHKAIVDLPFLSFKGYLAWFFWMFLHLMLILSVRNKLMIFINWAWSYLTRDSSLRLIISSRSHHDFNKQQIGYISGNMNEVEKSVSHSIK